MKETLINIIQNDLIVSILSEKCLILFDLASIG